MWSWLRRGPRTLEKPFSIDGVALGMPIEAVRVRASSMTSRVHVTSRASPDMETEVVMSVTGHRLEHAGELLEEKTADVRVRQLLGRSARGVWSFLWHGEPATLSRVPSDGGATWDLSLRALDHDDGSRYFTEAFGPRPPSRPLPVWTVGGPEDEDALDCEWGTELKRDGQVVARVGDSVEEIVRTLHGDCSQTTDADGHVVAVFADVRHPGGSLMATCILAAMFKDGRATSFTVQRLADVDARTGVGFERL